MKTFKRTIMFTVPSLAAVLIAGFFSGIFPPPKGDPTPTPTVTPTPKFYIPVSIKPEASGTPDPVPLAVISATSTASCNRIPEGWVAYIVQPGDRLYYLAPRYGLNHNQLAYFNCLPNPNFIRVGQILYVPPAPLDPAVPGSPSDTPGAGENQAGNAQGDGIFENTLVVITCRYPATDQAASFENCPRPAVDMLTVARQYNNGWVFYFPSLNQFYVQLDDGTPLPPFDESNLSADPYEDVSPEDTIERFVQAEQLDKELGTPTAPPAVYFSTVQWTADRQGFTISLPHWPVDPITAALVN